MRSLMVKEEQASDLLQFSKGIAILLIAFHHFSRSLWLARGMHPPNMMQWVFDPSGEDFHQILSDIAAGQFDQAIFRLSAQFGYFGVHLFVLMSGLGLAFGTSDHVKFGSFLKRRVSKLVPPFWTAVAFFVAFRIIIEQPYSFREIVERAFLLSTFDQANFFRVDPPLWCLAIFFQLYLLFLPLRYFVRRFGPQIILAFASLSYLARLLCMIPPVSSWNQNFGHAVGLNWLAVFGVGIWVGDKLRNEGRFVIPASTYALAAFGGLTSLYLSERFRAIYPIHDTAIALFMGATILLMWSALIGVFVSRWIAAVGSVSFPLYLYHRPIVGMVIFFWQKMPGTEPFDALTLSILTVPSLVGLFLLLQRFSSPRIAALALGSEPLMRKPVTVNGFTGWSGMEPYPVESLETAQH